RILDHLHKQRLALEEDLLDGDRLRRGRSVARLPEVGDVQERRALETDVEERRLHAGQHARDAREADVAGQAPGACAFDVEFLDRPLLHDRDARLMRSVVDQDLFGHRQRPAPRSKRAVSYRGRPMIPEWLPSIRRTNRAASPWIA